jgi:hypothetical protein
MLQTNLISQPSDGFAGAEKIPDLIGMFPPPLPDKMFLCFALDKIIG